MPRSKCVALGVLSYTNWLIGALHPYFPALFACFALKNPINHHRKQEKLLLLHYFMNNRRTLSHASVKKAIPYFWCKNHIQNQTAKSFKIHSFAFGRL